MELGLKDKTALVTGASAGLGFAAAKVLSEEGARVIINSRSDDNLKVAAANIEKHTGRRPDCIAFDLTIEGNSEALVDEAIRLAGEVDILVSNAGGPPSGDFMSLSKENWDESTKLTLMSAIDLSRAVIPGMKKNKWGRIIYITSVSAKQPIPGLIISNTLRAGVTGFAKSISNELAGFGITINTVCPGFTNTERLGYLAEKLSADGSLKLDDVYNNWKANIPAGRIGEPDELANLICFLVSEKASYITGTSIAVDGGYIKGLL